MTIHLLRLAKRSRTLSTALASASALIVMFAFTVGPASAIVTTAGSTKVGLQPRSTSLLDGAGGLGTEPQKFANNGGAPVLSSSKVYAIYWDPTDHYHGDWQGLIDNFLQSMGAASGSLASVFAVDTQYTDAANHHALYSSTFQGAYTDTSAYPASNCEDPHPLEVGDRIGPMVGESHTSVCLTDRQMQEELELFIVQHSLQKGMGTIFYLLTPPGVTVCLDAGGVSGHCSDYKPAVEESYLHSFCSYHSVISPTAPTTGDSNTIIYGVIPWVAGGLADGHLGPLDRSTPAYDCQDGGFDPSSQPAIEQREKKKEVRKNEKKEEEEPLTKEEKEKKELKEALEGPHQQEPNQQPCPTPDGYCDTGLADLIVSQIGVEQQNIVTNPLLNAWQDPNHNEVTDECRNFFAAIAGGTVTANEETGAGTLFNQALAGNSSYINDAFNLAAVRLPYPSINCLPGIRLEPKFTAPNPVNANELVGFDGMESDISLNAGYSFSSNGEPRSNYATFTWSFGDGSAPVSGYAPGAPSENSPSVSPCVLPWEAPCAASAYHSYQYGGTYEVTLTVTDVGGNMASTSQKVTVVGPPRPTPPSPSPGGPTTPGTALPVAPTTPAGTPPQGTPPVVPVPAPVVTGLVTSKSLKKALDGGLPIRYTANEQVAGNIQVLLDSATAKRLGIHGATATGLPKGSPSSIVVVATVLVTTKGGQGTIHIKFPPRTAARLKHIHKLKLTLRIVARNASRQSPQTTTVLSTVTLNR